MNDDKLVERIMLGDEKAAEELIKRYYTPILRYCKRQCFNLEKAEDLTQETFLKLFKNLSGYKEKRKFKAYLYTIANHLCIDENRKMKECFLENEEEIGDDCAELHRLEDQSEIEYLLNILSPEQREAVILRFGEELSFQWFGFGSSDDVTSAFGNNFDGYERIRDKQKYSSKFGGELTDKSLQKLVRDYQKIRTAGIDGEWEKTDCHVINGWLGTLYPELLETDRHETMMDYVNPKNLTGFYERRQSALEDFLENNSQTGAEKAYLLQINAKVNKPFRYEWTEGWSNLLGSTVADIGTVMALFLAITLSSIFAGEWHDNTSSLVLTTRNGWNKIALAKICTGLSFATEFFGKYVWSPYLLLIVPILIGVLCMPFAVKGWSRRLRS